MAGHPHDGIVEELVMWGAPIVWRFDKAIHVIDLAGVDSPLKGWKEEDIQRGLDALLESSRIQWEITNGEQLRLVLFGKYFGKISGNETV